MKAHLVSILWVEFSRKHMEKQNEKQYPAMKSGFFDNDVSVVCSVSIILIWLKVSYVLNYDMSLYL